MKEILNFRKGHMYFILMFYVDPPSCHHGNPVDLNQRISVLEKCKTIG